MTPDKAAIRTYFAKLGLDYEIADLYLALHAMGPQTISELSRSSSVERTRIYRLIDQLMSSGLVEVETQLGRTVLKPAPIANLRILISRREQELQGLQDELQMVEQVLGRNSLSSPAARIQMYQGPEGMRQMFWNQSRAKSQICAVVHPTAPIKPDSRYMARWIEACNKAGLHARVLASSSSANSRIWYGQNASAELTHRQLRYIPETVFPIAYTSVIYDDVVADFLWKDGEIYGVEACNSAIAVSQRQVFELLWKISLG